MEKIIVENTPDKADAFINSIRRDGQKKAGEIKASAEKEVHELAKRSEQEKREFTEQMKKELQEMIAREITKLNNRAVIDKRKTKLRVIEEITDVLIARSLETIIKQNDTAYKKYLRDVITRRISAVSGKHVMLVVSENDKETAASIAEEIKQSNREIPEIIIRSGDTAGGGVIITDIDLNMSYNATFSRIIFRIRDSIRNLVYSSISDKINIIK